MIEELIGIHIEVMNTTPRLVHRYLWDKINWDARVICVFGDRGVGKTTLMCQYLLEKYKSVTSALYISADNINVISHGLFTTAKDFFAHGGQALFIDEIHKYPDWSIELKNIIDTYRKHQIIFSGSSTLDLQHSKGDLSRRAVYYKVPGLSFREYLNLALALDVPAIQFDDLLKHHVSFAEQFRGKTILKHFKDYLQHGYYPYFVEGITDYLSKVNNTIEKIIFEDLAVVYRLKPATLTTLKRILWLIATSEGLIPNIDSLSKNFAISRESIYDALEYLDKSGLIRNLYANASGMKFIRKPGKIYLNNTNLLYAINGTLKTNHSIGVVRETFFVNQVANSCKISLHEAGDYLVDDRYIIEVGGRGKTKKQIKQLEQAYLAVDDIEIGFGTKIPLYLFGFLY